MTVPSSVAKSGPYLCNGVTDVFNYDFRIVDKSHLNVILANASGVETTLDLTTHYTVSDVGADVGAINLTSAGVALAVTGTTLTILRNPPFTQETDLQNQGAYLAQTVEDRFDLLTMQIQTVKERSDRSIAIPASDEGTTLDELAADLIRVAEIAGDVSTVAANVVAVDTAATNIAAVIDAPNQAAAALASAIAAGNSEAATEAILVETEAARDAALGAVPNVFSVSRTALKALDTTTITAAHLKEPGREGQFIWTAGDFSAKIAADTKEAIYIKADAVAATAGAWVRVYSGPASVRWFGAKGDGAAADLAALQAATDLVGAVFIPNGTYPIDGPWLLDDNATLHFESRKAIILSSASTAIIRPRGSTSYRNFHITMFGGMLEGSGKSGPVGLDLSSASMVKVFGTFITRCSVGVLNGGDGSKGAYYNDFFGVDITTVTTGYRNGTLGNEIHVYGGRVSDCVVGTDDDDNSGVLYDGVAIEAFSNSGHRLANSGHACVDVRSIGCRFENPADDPAYSGAIGIKVNAAAQDTSIISPGFTTVDGTGGGANNIVDSGVRTQVLFAEDWNKFAGGTRFKTVKRITVSQAIASLAAGTGRQDFFAMADVAIGDSVAVVLPPTWPAGLMASPPIAATGGVYIQLWNPTASAIDMSTASFTFDFTDYI